MRASAAEASGVGPGRLLFAAFLVAVAAGCGGAPTAVVTTTTATAVPRPQPARPPDSIVATATRSTVAVYRTAKSRRPFLTLANPTASGAPLTFLVRVHDTGRDEVYLAIRPNGRRGFVDDRFLTLARDPYKLEVHLRGHRLVLRNRGRLVSSSPIAVGRTATPTPKGLFYVVELLAQPDPRGAYGPFAFGLSAYSDTIFTFGGGPGQIGIHGTNEVGSIGRNASHGCIRVANAEIRRLARLLPLGTPVEITS